MRGRLWTYRIIASIHLYDTVCVPFNAILLVAIGLQAVAQLDETVRHKPQGRGFDTRWCQWNSSFTKSLRWHPTSTRNEYQEYFPGGKGGRCVWLTNIATSSADCVDIRGPGLPGTLRACRCLHRDCFTVYIQTTGFHVYLCTIYRHSIAITHIGHPLLSLQTPSSLVAIGLYIRAVYRAVYRWQYVFVPVLSLFKGIRI